MVSTDELFHHLLSLADSNVEIGLLNGTTFSGSIGNVMFDSVLLRSRSGTQIIRFSDIGFVQTAQK